jgi:hypothetical protein
LVVAGCPTALVKAIFNHVCTYVQRRSKFFFVVVFVVLLGETVLGQNTALLPASTRSVLPGIHFALLLLLLLLGRIPGDFDHN